MNASSGTAGARASRLWSDAARERHFLLPTAADLPAGGLVLRDWRGAERRVDPTAIAPFEISREEARAWLKAESGKVLEKVTRGRRDARPRQPDLPGTVQSAAAAVDAFLAGGGSAPRSGAERPANPATRMFAAWSGQDAERVGRDPKALLAGLRAVGEDVREIMRDAVSGDPERHARAEARLAELKRLQAEAGLASDAPPEPAGAGGSDDPDSPEARFRGRLHTILEEAVGRLERLKAEVESDQQGNRAARDDNGAPPTAPHPHDRRT